MKLLLKGLFGISFVFFILYIIHIFSDSSDVSFWVNVPTLVGWISLIYALFRHSFPKKIILVKKYISKLKNSSVQFDYKVRYNCKNEIKINEFRKHLETNLNASSLIKVNSNFYNINVNKNRYDMRISNDYDEDETYSIYISYSNVRVGHRDLKKIMAEANKTCRILEQHLQPEEQYYTSELTFKNNPYVLFYSSYEYDDIKISAKNVLFHNSTIIVKTKSLIEHEEIIERLL